MSKNVTLLFPGQGSQYVGMGKSLEGQAPYQLFERANQKLEFSLSKICFEGPEEDLKLTANAQPAILTYSIALYEKLKPILDKKNINIDQVLGHSVGEYSALVAAGVLSFEDAVQAVNLRGQFMQDAVPAGKGKMYAIVKVDEALVRKACEEVSTPESQVMPANFNDPSQIVISGEANACDRAVNWLHENFEGKMRAIELKVSAPFHSSLMKPAAIKLENAFEAFNFNKNSIPYIANINTEKYEVNTDPSIIKENLIKQVDGSVLWTQSIQKLADNTICIEVGPGRVLAGLVRKINPNITVISLDKDGAFDSVEEL